jgi:hypothetical protein
MSTTSQHPMAIELLILILTLQTTYKNEVGGFEMIQQVIYDFILFVFNFCIINF